MDQLADAVYAAVMCWTRDAAELEDDFFTSSVKHGCRHVQVVVKFVQVVW